MFIEMVGPDLIGQLFYSFRCHAVLVMSGPYVIPTRGSVKVFYIYFSRTLS